MKRVILIVLDSVGIGELPDADLYSDRGSNTLCNIKKEITYLDLKNMNSLGLSNIDGAEILSDTKITNPKGVYCKLNEFSKGKDTTVGHWEIAGLHLEKPFPTYPNGFPKVVIDEFEKKTGRKVIGNCTASGTEIIERLGEKHVVTGDLIVYTSADSVFQIAAHEDIVPIEKLYHYCQIARDMLVGEHSVSRVIARPFIGKAPNFTRTKNRKDFSLKPLGETMLDYIKESGQKTACVGKIEDIFAGIGVTDSIHTSGNMDSVNKTLYYMESIDKGLIFANLVDFDMVYGHRNDVKGYADALIEFDNRLPEIIANLKKEDILMITADHGCDPTTSSTDHSREYIPLLIFGDCIKENVNLGVRNSFSDIGKTILEYLDINNDIKGISFLKEIIKK